MKIKKYRYNMQEVCFECRKVFKIAILAKEEARRSFLSRRISGRNPTREFIEPKRVCPQCGTTLQEMGRAFRAPKKDNVEQWKKVEVLARNGFYFWSHVGQYPRTLNEAKVFVATRKKRSDGEKLAISIRNKRA